MKYIIKFYPAERGRITILYLLLKRRSVYEKENTNGNFI